MKNSKKLLSLALCLALVFSTFACLGTLTLSAVGTEDKGYRYLEYGITYWYSNTGTTGYTSGSGTAADPYIITTAAELRHLARGETVAGRYYKLGNDIVINDSTNANWYEEPGLKNWIKGTDANGNAVSDTMNGRELGEFLFRGNFDGDGHTISGLFINYTGTGQMDASGTGYKRLATGWALFPSVQGATIKNLKLKDVYIKSNVTQTCTNQPQGYGALIGYCYSSGANVSNVQIENVKYDLQSPNQAYTNYRIGVGSIIGYAAGPITATDCIVKNISGKAVNKYFTGSGKPGSAGSIIGFVAGDSGCKHTLKNIISIGRMNPLSAGVADPAFVTTNTDTAIPLSMPIRTGSSATNVYAIGDVSILAGSNITKAVDEATFKSTYLDAFYNNITGSTNWSEKNPNEVPYLKLFPETQDPLLKLNFSNYTTKEAYANSPNANTNWTIVTEENTNKYLQGDFTTVTGAQDFAFTITPNAALGNGSNITGYYGWGESGIMQPGTVYKLDFKAKAENPVSMSYAIYNGYSFGAGYNNRDEHITAGIYDASGTRVANLTTDWQEYSMYFTAESYPNNNGQGTNRPIFQIQPNTSVYGNKISFDDVVMTPVNAVSFKEYDNHYSQPCVGEIGEAITVPATNPKREGYRFDGWYIDEACTVALDAENTKIGDITVAFAKWSEAAATVLNLNFTNYVVGSSNTNSNWAVTSEGNNNILKGTISANLITAGFGFTLVDNSKQKYDWGVNGPLVPGKTYMVTFKAKAKNNSKIDFAIYSGYSYAKNSFEKHRYYDQNNILQYEETGNVANLTNEWATYTAYFTADEYIDPDNGGVNRPVFYINNRDNNVWNNEFYFDDFEIIPCDNYVSYNLYDGKYANPFVAENGADVALVNPERKDYVFEGWYQDANFTNKFTATTLSGEMIAYAKWSEAITTKDDIADITEAGTYDLGLKVSNANAYPIKFNLATDDAVTVSIFTASDANATDKSVVWTRTFAKDGTIGALIDPAIINTGNKLFISVDGEISSISEFVIGGENVPTSRYVVGDVNGDNKFGLKDLVAIKKMSAGITNANWLSDLDEDGYIAEATDLTKMRTWLIFGIDDSVKKKIGDRTLVWNEEFNSGKLNTTNFGYADAYGTNMVTFDTEDTLNYFNGNANLKVNNFDGVNYKVSPDLTSSEKMSFNKGYLEVRAKVNAVPGQWASIWLTGDKTATYQGEIDIFETYNAGYLMPNIHSWKNGERAAQYGDKAEKYVYADNGFNKTEYHIFGFEWDDSELKFYVDGVCYETIEISKLEKYNFGSYLNPVYPFDGLLDQFYSVRLTNIFYADSLSNSGAMPEFNIDYVRLYQNADEQLKINGEIVAK